MAAAPKAPTNLTILAKTVSPAVSNLVAEAGIGVISLSWNEVDTQGTVTRVLTRSPAFSAPVTVTGRNYTDSGLSTGTYTYSLTVYDARGVIYSSSSVSTSLSVTGSGSTSSIYAIQNGGYTSVIPGEDSFAHDFGVGPAMGADNVCYLDRRTHDENDGAWDAALGVWRGSWEYLTRRSMAASGPASGREERLIIPVVGGFLDNFGSTNANKSHHYAGMFVPPQGLIFKNTRVGISASKCIHSHMQVYLGSDFADPENGDGFGAFGATVEKIIRRHCETAWTMDEAQDLYLIFRRIDMRFNAVLEPLAVSSKTVNGFSHNYGDLIDAEENRQAFNAELITYLGNLHTDCASRGPLIRALKAIVANNTNYNGGYTNGQAGEAIYHGGPLAAPSQFNAIRNVNIKGPSESSSLLAIVLEGLPAGSQGYVEGNSIYGRTAASQQALVVRSVPSGWHQGSIRSVAVPSGWVTTGFPKASNNVVMSAQEAHDWIDDMSTLWGSRPAIATRKGRVAIKIQQMHNAVDGAGDMGSIKTSTSAGDFSAIQPATTTIDPANPGSTYHAPIPARATWKNSVHGTFPDGSTKEGYNVLDEWVKLQDLKVLGRY